MQSHVVEEDLHRHWNEVFEVIVTSIPGQELEVEVFDKDLDKDDFLGRCKVSLTTALNNGFLDEWLTLEDVSSGRLHLRLERLTPQSHYCRVRGGAADERFDPDSEECRTGDSPALRLPGVG